MKMSMSKPLVTVAAVAVLAGLVAAMPAQSAGYIFGVRPGQLLQRAYFGADMGKFVPMVGLDYLGVSLEADDLDISASLFVPHVGARMYFGGARAAGNVVPYIEGSLMYSFAMVNLGEGASELEDIVEDALGFWGIGVLFGAEYFFSDRFSVAGEYGLHYLKDTIDLGGEIEEMADSEVKAGLKTTYTGVALSFHF
ncbi:MAG: hypothetical protein WAW06_00125 [bacterium]